jgi:hypothetical protein
VTKTSFAAVALIAVFWVGFEVWANLRFYRGTLQAAEVLSELKVELRLDVLDREEAEILDLQSRLADAQRQLRTARRHADRDPAWRIASLLPGLGKQVDAVGHLVRAAETSAWAGLAASEVLLAFSRHEDDPQLTSVQEGSAFIKSQESTMATVRNLFDDLQEHRRRVPDSGLLSKLARARDDLDAAIRDLEGLLVGYERASAFLPGLLGMDGARHYLILPQNETEIFPSGGLISSYGIATFSQGKLERIELEYFGTLFDRWQKSSGGEYVEPPGPLKNYLKRHMSWGLGEAGWFPDFPTTAGLAQLFTEKGGAVKTDGVIAIDLQFVEALLGLLGPVRVPEYGTTITAENLAEKTLELTRGEEYLPGAPKKAFLSFLASAVLEKLFATPKDKWVDLLKLLDAAGQERHLQLHFLDSRLQSLAAEYGFDGSLVQAAGDFLLITDTSVNSTKLNLVLETTTELTVSLGRDGSRLATLNYDVKNPFPRWAEGRDPWLVRALMLDGVYGSYLRFYVPRDSVVRALRLDGEPAGIEQLEVEFGKTVFGRFFPVLPGQQRRVQAQYWTEDVVKARGELHHYSLYVQKQAGTRAMPLSVRLQLPAGATLERVLLDGRPQGGLAFSTDLRVDRRIEVYYRLR